MKKNTGRIEDATNVIANTMMLLEKLSFNGLPNTFFCRWETRSSFNLDQRFKKSNIIVNATK
ncbi:hypothetical protein D039_0219 [Vibrio parahaemolyticus EKP-028]|nr:hypothetical protein D039_0219 [Vibrio parahaemolyticus EKP-028]